MKTLFFLGYIFTLIFLSIFSWGFVDANFPVKTSSTLSQFVWVHRDWTTLIYLLFILTLFVFYGWFLRNTDQGKLSLRHVVIIIASTTLILLFAFPAFAYDILNYIATAKVTFLYKENPYVVMPIEIQNEPMLAFMHAANKVALYGFIWILLTGVPLFLGLGKLILTVFTFKAFIAIFYGILLWLIWQLSTKSLRALVFFALNPLVVLETLISAHNDVVMMVFALAAFYLFKKNRLILSLMFLIFSIFIKLATVALIPIFIYLWYLRFKKGKIIWKSIWKWSAVAMYVVFFFSPLREEIYAWYLIWPLTFVALIPKEKLLTLITLAFSFGLPLRMAPFLYTREWSGITPLVKKIITLTPPSIIVIYYALRKKI